jgi:hypothetical protein
MPFKKMENIANYLKAVRAIGMKEFEMFGTPDLYEEKNMNMVINSFHALGRTLQTIMPDAPFPKLGIKIVEKNERHFSEQQLREAANAVSVMSLGSSKLAQKAAGDVLAGRAALTDVLGEPTKGVQEHHAAPAPKPAAATPAKPAAAAAAADALPAGWVSAWTDEGCACTAARGAAAALLFCRGERRHCPPTSRAAPTARRRVLQKYRGRLFQLGAPDRAGRGRGRGRGAARRLGRALERGDASRVLHSLGDGAVELAAPVCLREERRNSSFFK